MNQRRLLTILGWAFLAALVGIVVVVLVQAHRHNDYWDVAVPGVLTGSGTLALAGVTYRVLLGDQADRRKRDEQDVRRSEQERRAQASHVQVSEAVSTGASRGNDRQFWESQYRAEVENRSDDAIGEAQLLFVVSPRSAVMGAVDRPVSSIGRVTAGQSTHRDMVVRIRASGTEMVTHEIRVWLTFRDAAGVMWARDPSHKLIEISDDDASRLAFQAERGMTNGLQPDPGAADTYSLVDEGPWGTS